MKVPQLDLTPQHNEIRAEVDAAIKRVIDSNYFILGPEVAAFESELAEYLSVKKAVGVSSGTDALLVALMALDVGPGDEVVTTPYTFFATVGSIVRLGAKPVLADIEPDTLNLSAARAQEKVGTKTKAVIPVHLYGRPCEVPDVGDVAVIEDAAQSIGAGKLEGTMATYSFFPAKNLGAFGDGGAVTTNDEELGEKLRVLRTHGSKPKYFHALVGGNFRLDALQAAVLRVKLPYLDRRIEARRKAAGLYRQLFAQARVPAELTLLADHPEHVNNQFLIRTPRRDELKEHLGAAGIGTAIYYPLPLHLQKCFADLGYREGSFPVAEAAAKDSLALPIGPSLTPAQQEYVVGSIETFFAS